MQIKDQEKARFENFRRFVVDELNTHLEIADIRILWNIFLEYLYNSFFEYGVDALRTLHPQISGGDPNGYYENVLSTSLRKLKPEHRLIFKQIIERFPDFASSDDINFINELAQKTLSFSSLGFEKNLAEGTIDHDLVDWVLYLDTNVLYSLLDLHIHQESDACKALVQLILDNHEHLKVKLRYSDITFSELKLKKSDLKLLDDKITDSAIRAMLKSEKLDGFSKKFYENLLQNRDTTIHPSEVIDLSHTTLQRKTIDIARNAKRIEHFFTFISKKNEIRLEYSEKFKRPYNPYEKSERQAKHDVNLRELILDSRQKATKNQEITLNSIKYFAVTLDELLIKYDREDLKSYEDERSFPVFFKPSFLLNRLVRVLPIKTEDYKKAFIKAVTSRGFHKETNRSRDVLKIVNYLKSQGIDDERIIYNIISKDVFIEKYHEQQYDADFNQGSFIQSEIDKEYKDIKEQLAETSHAITKLTSFSQEQTAINEKLIKQKEILESDQHHYINALKQLQDKIKNQEEGNSVPYAQGEIDFKTPDYKRKAKKSIEREITAEKKTALKKWQKKTWWNLFWVVPLFAFAVYLLVYSDPKIKWTAFIAVCTPITLVFLVLIQRRFWDEANKEKWMSNYEVSRALIKELEELDD